MSWRTTGFGFKSLFNEHDVNLSVNNLDLTDLGTGLLSHNGTDQVLTITTQNAPISFNSVAHELDLDYNANNLKITAGQLNTIQNIGIGDSPTFGGLSLNGNLITSGLLDGVDLAQLKTDFDDLDADVTSLETDLNGFPDDLKNLTAAEIAQLTNIDLNTITNTQWGYLSTLDQSLSMNDSVTFDAVAIDGNAQMLTLIGSDHCYIGFDPNGSGRKAYVGFGGASDNNFYIVNQHSAVANANVQITTEDAFKVDSDYINLTAGSNITLTAPAIYINTNGCPINWFISGIGSVSGINFSGSDLLLGNTTSCDNAYITSDNLIFRNTASTELFKVTTAGLAVLNNSTGLYIKDSLGTAQRMMVFDNNDDLHIGNTTLTDSIYYIGDQHIWLDTSSNQWFVINSSGDSVFYGDVRTDSSASTGNKIYFSLSNSNKFSLSLDSNIKFSLYDEGQAKQALVSELYNDKVYFPNGNVGIGTSSPTGKLNVLATSEQLRLGYDASNYTSFTVDSGGDLTVSKQTSFSNGIDFGNEVLDQYDEGTFTATFSSNSSSLLYNAVSPNSVQVTIRYVQVGNQVTLYIPEFSGTKENKAPLVNRRVISASGDIPSAIRPYDEVHFYAAHKDHVTNYRGEVFVTSTGEIKFTGEFDGSGYAGQTDGNTWASIHNICITYNLV